MDIHRLYLRSKNRFRIFWHRLTDRGFQGPMPFLSGTRESFEKALLFLLEPVVERYFDLAGGCVRKDFIVIESASRENSDCLELVARTFVGASYFLAHNDSAKLVEAYLALFEKGIDPASPHYWGLIRSDQVVVENASLILGLLVARDKVWDRFSEVQKAQFLAYIEKSVSQKRFRDNNWLWFKVFHFVFLEQKTGRDLSGEILPLLDRLSRFYGGDGWYRDGVQENENRFDYYNAWAMHYYALLFCLYASDRYEASKKEIRARFQAFKEDSSLFLHPQALPLPYGRSLIYRFAMLGSWGVAAKLGLFSEEECRKFKAESVGTLNQFFKYPILNSKRMLTPGYTRFNPGIVQSYSGSGSPYWAFKAFSFLLAAPGDVFWRNEKNVGQPDRVSTRKFISPMGAFVENSADGHLLLLNGGLNSRNYPAEYNKFCYSNRFWPVMSGRIQDHTFTFFGGNKSHRKNRVTRVAWVSGCLRVEWGIAALPAFKGFSTIVPLETGYLLISHFSGAENKRFIFGGFSVPAAGCVFSVKKNNMEIRSGKLISKLSAAGDVRVRMDHHNAGAERVLSGEPAVLPTVESRFLSTGKTLALLVEAGADGSLGNGQVSLKEASVVWTLGSQQRVFRRVGDFYEPGS